MDVRMFLNPRRISRMSRKSFVVIMPVLAPLSLIRVLVASVVPWIRRSTSARKEERDFLWPRAAFSREERNPTEGSWGVVGDLNPWRLPCSSRTRQSVNVPPTSMQALYMLPYLLALEPE